LKFILISFLPTKLYLLLRRVSFKINRKDSFNNLQNIRKVETHHGYSYKPFDEKMAIFVHIPKCAGISINKALFGNLAGGHTTLDDYICIFRPEEFSNYFKFTFVRNPWDRLVSAYTFLKKGGLNKYDYNFYQEELSKYEDFNDFVRRWLTPENIKKYHHFKPQLHYIVDRYNKVTVDYIGYFENLNEDFHYISNRMNVEFNLKKENSVNRASYQEYYEPDTRRIVAEVYKNDIQALNYTFDSITEYKRKLW
jgi:hypothetical protein